MQLLFLPPPYVDCTQPPKDWKLLVVVGVIVLVDVCMAVPLIIAGHVVKSPTLTTDDTPRLNVSPQKIIKKNDYIPISNIYILLLHRVWVFWNPLNSIVMNAGAMKYSMLLSDLPSCIS